MEILDDIPFQLDIDALFSTLHVSRESEDTKDIQDLVKTVTAVINPKAIYEVCYVERKNYDGVNIGGVIFTSRVLRVNLDKAGRVFPYIATCGKELDQIAIPLDDFVKRFWLDTIKAMDLDASVKHLTD